MPSNRSNGASVSFMFRRLLVRTSRHNTVRAETTNHLNVRALSLVRKKLVPSTDSPQGHRPVRICFKNIVLTARESDLAAGEVAQTGSLPYRRLANGERFGFTPAPSHSNDPPTASRQNGGLPPACAIDAAEISRAR